VSPSTGLLAFTSENSSLFLYRLYDDDDVSGSCEDFFDKQQQQEMSYQELVGGHSNAVFNAKFTHDSKYLLSCGADSVACLWDVSSSSSSIRGQQQQQARHVVSYSGHLYPVWDLETFSRLNLFATASKDGTARLWSFDHLYPLRIYCGHQSDVNCVRFHPNGAYLATGSSDKTIRLWSAQTGDFVRLFSGHRSRVFSVAFSPDGNYLASAGEDKKIKLWDLRSGGLFREFKGHTDIVHSLSFDNNSEVLCSGSLDRTVKFWDVHRKNIKIGR
jgi:transcription initiation factor TFIID subunit 5